MKKLIWHKETGS